MMYTKKHYEAATRIEVAVWKQVCSEKRERKQWNRRGWHMIHNEIKIYIIFFFVFYNHTKNF